MRSGVVTPQRNSAGRAASTFQDLVLLRTAKGLIDAKVPRAAHHESPASAREPAADRSAPFRGARADRRRPRDRSRQRQQLGARIEANRARLLDPRARRESRAARARVRAASAARRVDGRRPVSCRARKRGDRRNAEAENAYRNAIAADPAHVAAHINLGRLRHVGKALDEAERLYRRALELEPTHPTARFNLGVVLEDRGATSDAIEAVSRSRARSTRASPTCTSISRGSTSKPAISRPRYATSRASAR